MNDDRSERLRQKRNKSAEKAKESADSAKPSKSSKPSEPSEPDKQDKSDETSVKDEQVGTYLYLPKRQKKRINQVYNKLKADYEFEFDEEFEKNRHYYPLLIKYGLDSLESFDSTEIQESLEEMNTTA